MSLAAGSARRRVADFWDAHITAWLAGDDRLTRDLDEWFGAYEGTGRGAVTRDGFVEPYMGDLRGVEQDPRVVILGLNPGQYLPDLQARSGLFADEIRKAGSYSAWVRDHPYDNKTWLARHPPNIYFRSRLRFTRDWLQEQAVTYNAMLIFEMYPWHSTGITGPMRPPPEVIDTFVWQPIRETDVEHVFAFGAPLDTSRGPGAQPAGHRDAGTRWPRLRQRRAQSNRHALRPTVRPDSRR